MDAKIAAEFALNSSLNSTKQTFPYNHLLGIIVLIDFLNWFLTNKKKNYLENQA